MRGGQAAQIEALNAAFKKAYPNITIDRVSRSFEDFLATLRLAITDEEPPAPPVVILYLFLQRHFIQGIVEGRPGARTSARQCLADSPPGRRAAGCR